MNNGKISDKTRVNKTTLAQADVLERLQCSDLSESQYRGLRNCTAGHCGMGQCTDVCRYGSHRRRREQVKATLRLFRECEGPYFELRVGHGAWSRPFGQLAKVSRAAAKQLNRRSFDALRIPGMVAVGMMKVSYRPNEQGGRWKAEVHQVVGGIERAEVERAFAARLDPRSCIDVMIQPVTDLRTVLKRVLSVESADRLQDNDGFELVRPKASVRSEYYRWALSFDCSARLIRYGCDRHFNKLVKKGRTIRLKVRKPRPNPTWLAPWQFGSEERELRERFDAIERMHLRR